MLQINKKQNKSIETKEFLNHPNGYEDVVSFQTFIDNETSDINEQIEKYKGLAKFLAYNPKYLISIGVVGISLNALFLNLVLYKLLLFYFLPVTFSNLATIVLVQEKIANLKEEKGNLMFSSYLCNSWKNNHTKSETPIKEDFYIDLVEEDIKVPDKRKSLTLKSSKK